MPGLGLVAGGGARGLDLSAAGGVVLQRHGEDYALPHLIDHGANMRRLRDAGCERVLAIGSVGGLHARLSRGTFVVPDDFIALDAPPASALDGIAAHRVPGFDAEWRRRIVASLAEAGIDAVDGGVYWQATGPRLETAAEIRFIAAHADVIGMTIGSECAAAGELGLSYAAVCIVDNFANGVGAEELTLAEVEAGRVRNQAKLAAAVAALAARLA